MSKSPEYSLCGTGSEPRPWLVDGDGCMKLACRLDNRSPDVLDEGEGDSDLLELVGDMDRESMDDRGVMVP